MTLLQKGKTKIYQSSPHSQEHQTGILKIHRYLFLAALKKNYNQHFKISTKETGETAQGLSGVTVFPEDWSSATPGSLQPPVTVDLNNIAPSSGFYRHSTQMAHTERHKAHTYAHTEIKIDFKIGLSELTAVDGAYLRYKLRCFTV